MKIICISLIAAFCLPYASCLWMVPEKGPQCSMMSLPNGWYHPRPRPFSWSYNIGTKITFVCDEGYTLSGDKEAYCSFGNTWEGKAECKKTAVCSRPVQLRNGLVWPVKPSYQVRERVTFYCRLGYELRGARRSTCGSYGKFQPAIPVCERIESQVTRRTCKLPKLVDEVFVLPRRNEYEAEDTVYIDCSRLRKADSFGTGRCNGNGEFEDLPSQCIESVRCDAPQAPENSKMSPEGESFSVGETVTFECNFGYKLVGNATTLCGEDGKFSSFNTICEEIEKPDGRCSRPEKPENGKMILPKRSYKVGDSARFICRPSYTMVGESEVTCMSNNRWSSQVPTCKRSYCLRPFQPFNGFIVGSSYKYKFQYGEIVKFACKPSFDLMGAKEAVCGNDGVFSPSTIPFCQLSRVLKRDGSCKYRCNEIFHTDLTTKCRCDIACLKFGGCCDDYTTECSSLEA